MNEQIKLPEVIEIPLDPHVKHIPVGFGGCVTIRAIDGSPLVPLMFATDFQPFVLTCGPTDGKLVETQSFGIAEDINLGGSTFVCGYGYPDTLIKLGEDH